jgi:hypothetical protein
VGTEHCPACGAATILKGFIAFGEGYATQFVPNHCRATRTQGVPTAVTARACAACGHVWMTLDPGRLREYVATHGEEIARQELDELERGPYRDLPDTAVAREVADKVAELDHLARGRAVGVVGRYRELRGVTWDIALKEAGDWHRLTRAEKLALFGWTPKKKVALDDLDSPFP